MILRQWIPLQFMCSAAWLASVALLCLAEDQTIKMLRDPSAVLKTVCLLHQHIFPPVLCTAKLAKATAQGLQVLWVPLLQTSAKDQWMPSCFLPKNTELNILRCIQGKTTGNGIKICGGFFLLLMSEQNQILTLTAQWWIFRALKALNHLLKLAGSCMSLCLGGGRLACSSVFTKMFVMWILNLNVLC